MEIESTILDLSGTRPSLLQPGAVTPEVPAETPGDLPAGPTPGKSLRAPGALTSHYAPRTPLDLVNAEALAAEIERRLSRGGREAVRARSIALFMANALQGNIVFLFLLTEVVEDKTPAGKIFRASGLVERGRARRSAYRFEVGFVVTINRRRIAVHRGGILPDLFCEGQGGLTHGRLDGGRFPAREVLTEHGESNLRTRAAKAMQASAKAGTS